MKDLEVAEKDLEKMEQMAQSLQQLQQQAAQMGKDLAEQLDKGQADAAAATLRKLSEQLKAGKLTPEQLKAISDEVAKAIKPAGPYGKVPDPARPSLSLTPPRNSMTSCSKWRTRRT